MILKILIAQVFVCVFCLFGTKLKTIDSKFTEIAPGRATADVILKFDINIKVRGKKEVFIESIWIRNKEATWRLKSSEGHVLESISNKNPCVISGQIVSNSGRIKKGKVNTDEKVMDFNEEVVIIYKVKGSEGIKYLKIDKIEKIGSVKTK